MRVHIDYDPKNRSGKGSFLARLTPELEERGVKIQYTHKKADITLGVTKWRGDYAKKKVLRIDGIHLINDKKHLWNNKGIKKAIKKADAVIYQSHWAQTMIDKIFDIKPKSYVVYNGADPADYTNPIESPYPKNVIMSAKWKASDDRRQKRLPEMYEIAKEYVRNNNDVCFWIAGAHSMKDEGIEQIKWLGYLEQKELARYLAMADVMLNLAWWDWMPNAVVEAICARCMVIAPDQTGLGEMVKESKGITLPLDKPIPQKVIFKNNKPPKFDYEPVVKALDSAFKNWVPPFRTSFLISHIAWEYYNVFHEVLNEK